MLALLLMLAADPQALSPRPPVITYRVQSPDSGGTLIAVPGCPNGRFQQAGGQTETDAALQPNLIYRPDGTVRGYLLLEQSVEGCSRPLVFPLPNSPRGVPPEPRQGERGWRTAP